MSIDEMMRSISLNISYYRKQNKLSQRQLADLIGLSYSHMSHIEAPNMPISCSVEVLLRIAAALQIVPSLLFQMR